MHLLNFSSFSLTMFVCNYENKLIFFPPFFGISAQKQIDIFDCWFILTDLNDHNLYAFNSYLIIIKNHSFLYETVWRT